MIRIAPTITAYDVAEYNKQMRAIAPFAKLVHIDLMDGVFAPTVSPALDTVWWPHELKADIHLMYQNPMDYLELLIALKPRTVIIHAEADVHHMHFAAELHRMNIRAGLAILAETPLENTYQIMHSFDHVLIFSGHLGYHGGQADLELLARVQRAKEHHPGVEIGWDGGINVDNIARLVDAGVKILNVGGAIQKADDPETAYRQLVNAL